MKKYFTVEVEALCMDGATYRVLARTEKEALKKAKERFEKESLTDLDIFDIVEAKIKTKKQERRPTIGEFIRSLPGGALKDWGYSDKEIRKMMLWE